MPVSATRLPLSWWLAGVPSPEQLAGRQLAVFVAPATGGRGGFTFPLIFLCCTITPPPRTPWLPRLVVLLALLAGGSLAARAQQLTITAPLPTICLGGSTVLSVSNPQPNTTYTWSPSQDINTTGGPSVVVNPAQTTDYTVTATNNTVDAPPRTTTFTVSVQQDCCQQNLLTYNRITPVELTSATYFSNPFAGYAPGTYFHYAGSTLTLSGGNFVLPVGSVLLLEGGAEVVVDNGGRLELDAGALTAACNDMWKGLTIKNGANAIDFHGVNLSPGAPGMRPLAMRNRILHSQQGLVLEDGPASPEFQVSYTDFWHNFRSFDISRIQAGGNPGVRNLIRFCSFDTSPYLLKAPYRANGGTYYYADYHLRVAGRVDQGSLMDLLACDFNHALVHILCDRTRTGLRPASCTFSNFYEAGIYYAGGGLPSFGPASLSLNISPYGVNTFTFPAYPLPATPQLAAANATYASGLPKGVAGVATQDEVVNATAATFQQPQPANYNPPGGSPPAFYAHVGISTATLGLVQGCSFLDLPVGIAHALTASNPGAQLSQDLFVGCGRAYEITAPSGSAPETGAGTIKQQCGTFQRYSPTPGANNTSQYYGIYVDANTTASIVAPTPSPTSPPLPLTNKFDDSGTGPSGFIAINNNNLSAPLSYFTFDNYATTLTPLVRNVSFPPSNTTYYPSAQNTCYPTGPNGLSRQANTASVPVATPLQLEQSVPNPVRGIARISYQVPASSHAVLLLRRVLDGQPIAALEMKATATFYDLDLSRYPAGTYFYTLTTDDGQSLTRRLVVE